MTTAILIPARYNSTRFPGKPLTKLDGVPMIKRVYDVCKSSGLDTYVITDDMRIFNLFGPDNCWIEEVDYANGTERCAGAVPHDFFDEYDQFVNVQGDMPDVTVEMIAKCISILNNYPISTLFTKMTEEEQNNPNSVKIVCTGDEAQWFGRGMTGYGAHHLGIYGYKRHALETYPKLEVTQEEKAEQLEQLRWLKSGWKIGCTAVEFNGLEINTHEDANKWNEKMVENLG